MATNNVLNNYSAPFGSTTISATTFDTNVVAAAVTLSGTTLSADGTDADININITAKGTGQVVIDDLQLTTDLAVTEGGTGASTLTNHGVLLGAGTSAVSATAVGATGEILQGNTGADPSWLAASTDGKVLTAHTGAAPTWETPSPGGITWSVITSNQSAAADNGYICNKAGLLTLALPASCVVGKTIRVTGMNTAVGWRISQNANQMIHWDGTNKTTTGVGGYLESTDIYDSVEIVCSVADLEFVVVSSKGNITIA